MDKELESILEEQMMKMMAQMNINGGSSAPIQSQNSNVRQSVQTDTREKHAQSTPVRVSNTGVDHQELESILEKQMSSMMQSAGVKTDNDGWTEGEFSEPNDGWNENDSNDNWNEESFSEPNDKFSDKENSASDDGWTDVGSSEPSDDWTEGNYSEQSSNDDWSKTDTPSSKDDWNDGGWGDDDWNDASPSSSNTGDSWGWDDSDFSKPEKTENSGKEGNVISFHHSAFQKFAMENYETIGNYTIDSKKFYTITNKIDFSVNFANCAKSENLSISDSVLLPRLIKFANDLIQGVSTSNESSQQSSSNSMTPKTSDKPVNIKKEPQQSNPWANQSVKNPMQEPQQNNPWKQSQSSLWASGGNIQPSYEVLLQQVKALTAQIEELQGKVIKEREFFSKNTNKADRDMTYNKVMNNTQPFENLTLKKHTANFFSTPFEYLSYSDKKSFDINFSDDNTLESVAGNLVNLSRAILDDIYTMVGGAGRITTLMIMSGVIIINGVSYEPILPEEYVQYIPIADRNSILSGYFADYINYNCLRDMKNLVSLSFDSKDFVYGTVRKHLGYNAYFEPKEFFNICKSLMNLQIGEIQITRATKDDFDDVFHIERRSSQIADWCTERLDAGFSYGVSSIKDFWSSRGEHKFLGNAWGLAWRSGLTLAVGAGDLGLRTGRGAVKLAGKIKNGVNTLIDAMKEDL